MITEIHMRVLHMSSEKGWRGGEQQVAYLIEELSSRGINNIMVVKKGSRLEQFCVAKKIRYYTAKFYNVFDVSSALKVKKICSKENIDVIHLHASKAHGVGALAALLGNKPPMVLSRRVSFLPGKNIVTQWKYNQKRLLKIVAISEKITSIIQQYIKDPARCVTVYSGIDLKKFDEIKPDRHFIRDEFNIPRHKMILVAVGAIDASKDHFTFVNTLAHALQGNEMLQGLIIGDGPLRQKLEQYISSRGLDSHVTLAGHRRDVLKLLASADIFLMTSQEEGLGTSILDAFLARIPVVATNAGGIPEIVRHMETGLVAPVKDAHKLSTCINLLLRDNELRERLVNQAFDFVKQFSKEKTAEETLHVYQQIVK